MVSTKKMNPIVAKGPLPKAIPSRTGSTENLSANIKVVVRVRPPNVKEDAANSRTVVEVVDDKMLVFDPKEDEQPFFYHGTQQPQRNFMKRANKQMKFMFDNVLGKEASNEDVFLQTTKDMINALMDGFNCSVFVYGATGAGKTYTMIGTREHPGITYLTMDHLFKMISSFLEEREFEICVSYLEVYNEHVLDLLNSSKGALQLREDSKYGVVVAGLTITNIKTARELLDMLEQGNKSRTQHPTDANAESSRSHAVFQVYIKMRYRATGELRVVKLSMIDLAGSERASATGCVGDRFKEGANINRSLLSLGNCINKLADGAKFIPYRDSKLTRLLKDSLGGNCQTIMIANVSPSSLSFEDTYNTLKYAARANKIQSSLKKNIVSCDLHISQYVKIIEVLKKQIADLKSKLAAAPTSGISNGAIVVKKEPTGDPRNKSKIEWRVKIEEAFTQQCNQVDALMQLMSRQKVLMLRCRIKNRLVNQLTHLCKDVDDEELIQLCERDIPREKAVIQELSRNVVKASKKVDNLWEKHNLSQPKYENLLSRAGSDCPELSDFICTIKLKFENKLLKAESEHKNKLLLLHQEEMNAADVFTKEVPSMLLKYYLTLKGYGKLSAAMISEFTSALKKIKRCRVVHWSDNKDDDSVSSTDAVFQFISKLSLEKPKTLPLYDSEESEEGESIESNGESLSTTFNVLLPKSSIRKRKASTSIEHEFLNHNDTIVIDDSVDDLDTVRSSILHKKQNIANDDGINYLISEDSADDQNDIENKPIDPKGLNSTFVLAGKLDSKKSPIKGSLEIRKGLADRSNRNVLLPEKRRGIHDDCLAKYSTKGIFSDVESKTKPIVGKALPFRKPLNPPGSAGSVSQPPRFHGFGSGVARGATNGTMRPPAKLGNTQVGFKSVRPKERNHGVHPYARTPTTNKR